MAIRKLEHVGIMVTDMQKSIAFYRDILGLQVLGELEHNDPSINLVFMGFSETDDTVIELVSGYSGTVTEEGRVHHIALTVDDIELEVERLIRAGVTPADDGITTLSNGARYMFFLGPDRERVELFQPGAKN